MSSIFESQDRVLGKDVNVSASANTTAGKEFQNKGASLRTQKSEEEKQEEGSRSHEVKFLTCLANPAKKQSRQDSYSHTDIPCYEVVGYKFELLADAKVPRIPYKVGAKEFCDVEQSIEWIDHKKGDIICLNIMETGMFIGQNCYGGQISGDGIVVNLIVKNSQTRPVPRPCLRREGGAGSIKTQMEFVAELVAQPDSRKPLAVCKEEYKDTFGNLFNSAKVKKTQSKLDATQQAHKDNAAAFTDYFTNNFIVQQGADAQTEGADAE